MYAMFTQFRYTQDLGFGIELTEPTKLLNKPFPLTTTLPRSVIDENKFDLLHFITFFDSCERKALRPLRSGRTDEINYKM